MEETEVQGDGAEKREVFTEKTESEGVRKGEEVEGQKKSERVREENRGMGRHPVGEKNCATGWSGKSERE
eukprot:649210-Pleurochrysis_carterae.AAC.1